MAPSVQQAQASVAGSWKPETQALHIAVISGIAGAVFGLILGFVRDDLSLYGPWSFGVFATGATALTAAVSSTLAYLRSQKERPRRWQRGLAPWRYRINAVSIALAHTFLTAIATAGFGILLGMSFFGFTLNPSWSALLMGAVVAVVAYVTSLSAARVNTEHMSTLLILFILMGAMTAMITTRDRGWWQYHFSQLGTFRDLSGFIFNGTLIGAGLIVITFAVYVGNDIDRLRAAGVVRLRIASPVVSTMFALMGAALAGVGLVPINVSHPTHNVFSAGLTLVFLLQLTLGQVLMRGMPRSFFEGSLIVLGLLLAAVVLFATQLWKLTAFEIAVFTLIFTWISIFIRALSRGANAVDRERD